VRQLLYVLEFQAKDGTWDWFAGYATRAEAQADKARYGSGMLCDGRERKSRVTTWERLR